MEVQFVIQEGEDFVCPSCRSKNLVANDSEVKCGDCGVGHYWNGRR